MNWANQYARLNEELFSTGTAFNHFSGGYIDREVKLTTHFNLVAGLRMREAVPPSHMPSPR
jgi:hypothetical protein